MVRLRSVHSHIVACVSGRGRALVDGQVVEWTPGQVLLGPVGAHHAFEIADGGPWTIAWVFFDDTERAPALRGGQAELVDADSEDFVAILRLLMREASGPAQPAAMAALVGLLDTSARRLAGSDATDLRLWRLWERVEADLARPWTAKEMAGAANMSEEHLRRLCHKLYQRSPMKRLVYLRMSRASALLRSSSGKLDTIARQVGYASVYSFSAAFKRWSGQSPGHFRRVE